MKRWGDIGNVLDLVVLKRVTGHPIFSWGAQSTCRMGKDVEKVPVGRSGKILILLSRYCWSELPGGRSVVLYW